MRELRRRMIWGVVRDPRSVLAWLAADARMRENASHRIAVGHRGAPVAGVHTVLDMLSLECRSDASELARIMETYRAARARVLELYGDIDSGESGRAPSIISEDDGLTLYASLRALGARRVLETGVSDGMSSLLILEALRRNGGGSLHSVDYPLVGLPRLYNRRPGWLVPPDLESDWTVSLGPSRELLEPLLDRIGPIDAFLHDSEHSWKNMTWEFRVAGRAVRAGGLVMSDDAVANNAFQEYVRAGARRVSSSAITTDGFGCLRLES